MARTKAAVTGAGALPVAAESPVAPAETQSSSVAAPNKLTRRSGAKGRRANKRSLPSPSTNIETAGLDPAIAGMMATICSSLFSAGRPLIANRQYALNQFRRFSESYNPSLTAGTV